VAATTSGDGLVRWLIGGLVVGAIVLGLMVGAYAIGYHRGHEQARATAPSPAPPAATTTAPADSSSGKQLFAADGCSSCHSLDGSKGVGPTVKGLAGSRVQLTDGSTVTADDAYLTKAITDPDAQIVKGYQKGIMPAAIASFGLAQKPKDVAALVAFINSRR
jgi:cytochrome c2